MDTATGDYDNRQALLRELDRTPFDRKWDLLKPIMMKLYLEDNYTLIQVMDHLRIEYDFIAPECSFKYHINRKWKWKRNLPVSKTTALVQKRQKRAEAGKSTVFEKNGKPIPMEKMRRNMKGAIRKESAIERRMNRNMHNLSVLSGSSFVLGNSLFLNWYLPFGTMYGSNQRASSQSVPSPMSTSTPSDIVVTTPSNTAHSPTDAPSPLAVMHNMRETIQRAHLILDGRYEDLLRSMNYEDKQTMSKWLYQFWFYAFKTAKYWGFGPRYWNVTNLGLDALQPTVEGSTVAPHVTTKPSSLCRWSIHCKFTDSVDLPSRTPTPEPDQDPSDPQSWKEWPSAWKQQPVEDQLLDGLAGNIFSSRSATELPIATSQMVKSLRASPEGLQPEAFAFAIASRNLDLFDKLIGELNQLSIIGGGDLSKKLDKLNLAHLAALYLDGSRTCCRMLTKFFALIPHFRPGHVNDLGHTVLDNLMIAILKAHTSVMPGAVDDALRNELRFPGEEVDICGRFDADSDCVRDLTAKGIARIPFSWKHKFCHTSAQAVCHSIEKLWIYSRCIRDRDWLDNGTSGLFTKRCESCGLVMPLGCLHAVVMTAFTLAQFGTTDEDLFGILAVLVCLLRSGVNAMMEAVLAPSVLLNGNDELPQEIGCRHETLTAADLMDRVPQRVIQSWSEQKKKILVSWKLILQVLRRAEIAKQTPKVNRMFYYEEQEGSDDENISEDESVIGDEVLRVDNTIRDKRPPQLYQCCHQEDKCKELAGEECPEQYFTRPITDPQLGIISAAVQAELLTYRRLKEGDAWLSRNFDMQTLLNDLTKGNSVSIGLVKHSMLNDICICGRFVSVEHYMCPRIEDVSKFRFSNLEDRSRSTLIQDDNEHDIAQLYYEKFNVC